MKYDIYLIEKSTGNIITAGYPDEIFIVEAYENEMSITIYDTNKTIDDYEVVIEVAE